MKILGDDDLNVAGVALADDDRIVAVAATPNSPGEVFVDGTARTSFGADALADVELVVPSGREVHRARRHARSTGGCCAAPRRPGPARCCSTSTAGRTTRGTVRSTACTCTTSCWLRRAGRSCSSTRVAATATARTSSGPWPAAWGSSDTDDFLCAIDALVAEGIADPARLAVTGYSYGGYMTCWLTATTDRFAAAITGGCVSNLVSEAGTSDAGYHLSAFEFGGLAPGEVRLTELSPVTHVDGVRAPTLILHGERDDRCDMGQAEEWFTALRARRVETELVRYPGASHLFILSGRPSHRIDYCRRVADWAVTHTEGTT